MNKAKGLGLCLYQVKSLVDSYGGKVWVGDRAADDHMKGAKFMVALPLVEK
jgi:signal transduction histidine kinase